ncbi:MAG: hypothetical protein K8R90_02930 [Candidatus Cloacimonetes bacterium]|nr:hypothetical protein [Candidatus Cloacimonadota bacterium]
MKHSRVFIILLLATLFALTACSESDSTGGGNGPAAPVLSDTPDATFEFPESLDGYTSEDVNYDDVTMQGYPLAQFFPIEQRDMEPTEYHYQIVASDDWNPRNSSNTTWDLDWATFETGYLLPDADGRTWFPSDDVASAYNVKYADYVNMYRTIMVTGDDGLVTPFELSQYDVKALSYYYHDDDTEMVTYDAFPITNIITEYVTETPVDYSFIFVASDGWVNDDTNNTFTWSDMEKGWWVPEKNRVVFVGNDGYQMYKTVKSVVGVSLSE